MQLKVTVGVLLAVGLSVAGCGGVEPAVDEQSTLATRKDQLPSCDPDISYTRIFYSDAMHFWAVGRWECYCGESSAWVYGQWNGAPYYQDFNVQECY
jgi:hypothetical protein